MRSNNNRQVQAVDSRAKICVKKDDASYAWRPEASAGLVFGARRGNPAEQRVPLSFFQRKRLDLVSAGFPHRHCYQSALL